MPVMTGRKGGSPKSSVFEFTKSAVKAGSEALAWQPETEVPGTIGQIREYTNPGGWGDTALAALPVAGATKMAKGGWNVFRKAGPTLDAQGNSRTSALMTKRLPSGVELQARTFVSKDGTVDATINFSHGAEMAEKIANGSMDVFGYASMSMKGGMQRLGEVADGLMEYVSLVQPRSVTYSAGSSGLAKLYDRVTPKLAKQLGGRVKPKEKSGTGIDFQEYTIEFDTAKKWSK